MGRVLNPITGLARSVLDRGGEVVSASEVAWRVSGNCTEPVTVTRTGRPYVDLGTVDVYDTNWYNAVEPRKGLRPKSGKLTVEITARCRKCPNCLRVRAREWASRARVEVAQSARTWFGTLTVSAEKAYHYRLRACQGWRANGDLEAEEAGVIFAKWQAAIAAEITLMFKRLRKAGYSFRYMMVVEAHKSGTPHFHLLLHETSLEGPIRHAVLTAAWGLGFSNWKLVDKEDPKVVWYATKYLGKSKLARVRASLVYGNQIVPDDLMTEGPPQASLYPPDKAEIPTWPPLSLWEEGAVTGLAELAETVKGDCNG